MILHCCCCWEADGAEDLASSSDEEEEGEEERDAKSDKERTRSTIGSESQSGSGAERSVLEEGVSGEG